MRSPSIRAAAAAAALGVLACGLPFLGKAGLGRDEAWHAEAALVLAGRAPAWKLSEWPAMPWMRDDYNGALRCYLLAPVLRLAEPTTEALRAATLSFGAAAAALLVLLAGALWGAWAAWAAAAWLALDPALVLGAVFDTAHGVGVLVKCLALWAAARRLRGGGARWSFLCGLGLGWGVWDKASFLWLLAGAGAAALLERQRLRALLGRRDLLALAAGLCLGAAPLLAHNLVRPAATLHSHAWRAWSTAHADEGARAALVGRALLEALDGEGSATFVAEGGRHPLPWLPLALLLAAAALAWRSASASGRSGAKGLLLASAVVPVLGWLFPVPLKWHHLYLVYPLPHLAALAVLAPACAKPRWRAAAGAVLLVGLGANALMLRRTWTRLDAGLVTRHYSPWSRELAATLERAAAAFPGTPLFIEDGLQIRARFLTAGRLPFELLPKADALAGRLSVEPRALVLVEQGGEPEGAVRALAASPREALGDWTRLYLVENRAAGACKELAAALGSGDRARVRRALAACPASDAAARVRLLLSAGLLDLAAERLPALSPAQAAALSGELRSAATALEGGKRCAAALPLLLALSKKDPDLLPQTADCLRAVGRRAEALAAAKAGVAARPGSARAREVLVELTGAPVQRECPPARPGDSAALLDRAVCLAGSGREAEALEDARLARAARPAWGAAVFTEGALLLRAGDKEGAAKLYRETLKLPAVDPETRARLASDLKSLE